MIDRNKPWMHLAQILGHLANCLAESFLHRREPGIETSVELICCGEFTVIDVITLKLFLIILN